MANTYKFQINSVDCYTNVDGLENVIYQVHFTYIAQDPTETHYAYINNVVSLESPAADSFVDFDSLRDADVISWIEPRVDTSKLQESLDRMLQEKIQPTKVSLRLKRDPEPETGDPAGTEEVI